MQNFQNFFQICLKVNKKFISSSLWISFRIYLKCLKYFLKIFATFIPENFPEICTNFSKIFLKNLVNVSIKFYLRIAQIWLIVYPKFSENFLLFVDFIQISITISSHLNIFTINQQRFLWLFVNFFVKFYQVFLKIFSKNPSRWFLLGLKFVLSNVLKINFEIPQVFYRPPPPNLI